MRLPKKNVPHGACKKRTALACANKILKRPHVTGRNYFLHASLTAPQHPPDEPLINYSQPPNFCFFSLLHLQINAF